MSKEKILPSEALRIAMDSENFSRYKTYDLSRIAAFLTMLTQQVAFEINERIQKGEIV